MAGFDEKNVFQNRKVGHSIWKKILDGISQEDQPSTEVESRLNGDFWHKCREAMGVKDGRGPNHPGRALERGTFARGSQQRPARAGRVYATLSAQISGGERQVARPREAKGWPFTLVKAQRTKLFAQSTPPECQRADQ